MEKVAIRALAVGILTKYAIKIKAKSMTLEDTITVNDSIDLFGEAASDFIQELNASQHRPEQNPKQKHKIESQSL